jgi:hypothetical protein
MAEALRASNAYMFAERRLHRIMANYRPENYRSARLLQRPGLPPRGEWPPLPLHRRRVARPRAHVACEPRFRSRVDRIGDALGHARRTIAGDQPLHGGRSHLLHREAQIAAKELEDALDAGLPEGSQAPDVRAARRTRRPLPSPAP